MSDVDKALIEIRLIPTAEEPTRILVNVLQHGIMRNITASLWLVFDKWEDVWKKMDEVAKSAFEAWSILQNEFTSAVESLGDVSKERLQDFLEGEGKLSADELNAVLKMPPKKGDKEN